MNNTNPTSEELFNFPCNYSVKVFGKTCEQLTPTTCKIIEKHAGNLHPKQISSKQSSKGGYTAINFKIIATSRTQLDAMNQDLQDCSLVAYVL
jgi:putative lipoic acid-binding regulatory protein